MRLLIVPAALALTTLLPMACSSFDASESADAGPPVVGPEGGADGAAEADGGGERAKTLYIFGGVTVVGQYEEMVFEAYAAAILEDGSLGPWNRTPGLDVGRSYMTAIASPDGLLVMAGGNGVPIGEGRTGNFAFYRDDVGVAGLDPLGSWKAAPSLGGGSGRRAAPGTFASSGKAYLAGGIVAGDGFANTILAAAVTGAPPSLQPWQAVGTLPFAMAEHGLVALGSRLYVIGGSAAGDGGVVATANTFMAPIAGDGTVGGWAPTGSLPKPVEAFGVAAADGRVFVIGGTDAPASTSASVFIGSQTPAGELVWQETTPMKHDRRHLCVLRANGRLYALGGSGVAAVKDVVEVGEVSGNSVTWRETTPMPITRSAFGCAAR